jgi:hypothetical protein
MQKDLIMNQPSKATLINASAQRLADEHAQMLHQQNQCLRRQLSHERTTLRQTRAALHRMTWLVQLSEREADQRNYAANVRTILVVIALVVTDAAITHVGGQDWQRLTVRAVNHA